MQQFEEITAQAGTILGTGLSWVRRICSGHSRRAVALRTGLVAGAAAGEVTGAVLAALSWRQSGSIWRVFNATSHWVWGSDAGDRRDADIPHTATGIGTHYAASMFWGAIFGAWVSRRRDPAPAQIIGDAALVAGVAAVVDYGLMPRRLSPGWELALPPRGVALGFCAMAAGLALGGMLARPR